MESSGSSLSLMILQPIRVHDHVHSYLDNNFRYDRKVGNTLLSQFCIYVRLFYSRNTLLSQFCTIGTTFYSIIYISLQKICSAPISWQFISEPKQACGNCSITVLVWDELNTNIYAL